MRILQIITASFFVLVPALALAQTSGPVAVQVAAGPTLIDTGYNLSAGAGYSPNSRLTLQLDVERMHLFTRTRSEGRDVISSFRGGTVTTVSGEVRVSILPRDRFTPYAFIGAGAGTSRPNVNDTFPGPVSSNSVRVFFAGAGLQAPVGRSISLFADARMMLGVGTDSDELIGAVPIRAGVSWRF